MTALVEVDKTNVYQVYLVEQCEIEFIEAKASLPGCLSGKRTRFKAKGLVTYDDFGMVSLVPNAMTCDN